MLLHEVQRRNRRRLVLLATASFLNHWLIVAALGTLWLTRFVDLPWSFAIAGGVAAVAVGGWLALELVTAVSSTLGDLGARRLEPGEWPRLTNLIAEVAIASGTTPVAAAYVEDPVPNALTVGAGRSSSVLVVTTGLVERLTRDELEAVVAVQLCSVERLDVAVQTVAIRSGHAAGGPHRWLLPDDDAGWWERLDPRGWMGIAVTWPSKAVGDLLRWRAHRTADFGADDMALATTRHPQALCRAMRKLLDDTGRVRGVTFENAALWFEPMPYGAHLVAADDRRSWLERLTMSPSLEARIARLEAVGG